MANKDIGLFLIGIAIGSLIPNLPKPVDLFQPYVWLIFLVIGIVLLVRS